MLKQNPLEEIYLYTLKTAQVFQASKRSEHMVNVIMASWFISLSFITHAQSVNNGIFDKEDVKFHEIFILCAKTCI